MKDMTAATTHVPVTKTRHNAAAAALRRCAEMLIDGLKWCDPMACNAYWIGANPAIWSVRK